LKTIRNILFLTIPAFLIALIILEVFFRIGIPASDPPRGFFDEKESMYYFSNDKENGIYTIGKFATIRTKWRINNMHWNYPIDYHQIDDRKLIAVIGDSYIEAFQVDVGKNYPFLLREKLKNDYEVYAFGVSGAPLSQYLHISRYVKRHFDADILIFNLIHNDFEESIHELEPDHGRFFQVSIGDNGSIKEQMPQPNYSYPQYKLWKRIIYKSALFRYIYLNCTFRESVDKLLKTNKNYESNINTDNVNSNKELIFKATNYLVKTIREENSDKRVIFVFDAPRFAIYDNILDKSNIRWMNKMMGTICANNNVEYIDLAPFMEEDYRKMSIKFNFDIDGHWNEYGHKFVGNVLFQYLRNNFK